MDTNLLTIEILEVLRNAERPLMAKEIMLAINNKQGLATTTKSEINKAAFSKLRNELVYDPTSYTYRLISDKEDDSPDQERGNQNRKEASQNQNSPLPDEIRLLLRSYNKSISKKYEILQQVEEAREELWHEEIIELSESIQKSITHIENYCKENKISLSSLSPYMADKDYHRILDQVSKTTGSKSTLKITDIKLHSKIDGESCFNKELLYPLIYNLPLPSKFRTEAADIARKHSLFAHHEQTWTAKKLRPAILSAQSGYASDEDWKIIYAALKKCIIEQTDEPSSAYRQNHARLQQHLKNPYHYFSLASDAAIDNISFTDESERFDMLFLESTRDNVITDAERDLLYEKASQYGVNTDKLELALNNQFKAYFSFKVLVDEVCEDGIITEAERHFIDEKSSLYNIPKDLVNQLLANGLIKAKGISSLKNNELFYELIIIYLLLDFIDQNGDACNNINNYIYNYLLKENEINSTLILFKKEQMKRVLYKKANEILGIEVCSMTGSIKEFVDALELEIPPLGESANMEKLSLDEIDEQLDETIIDINGNNISFKIQYLPGLRSDAVFNHEMKGNTVFITHGYPKPSPEFKRFLAAHVYTRIQHGRNKTAKQIFNSFNRNLIDFLTNE